MYKLITKYNNISLLIKLLISSAAVFFLLTHKTLKNLWLQNELTINTTVAIILILFSSINWLLEIKKWQYLASKTETINFYKAGFQSFISFSVSLLTPNRIGEYGAKVLFFETGKRKKIFSLSIIGTTTQLLATLFFGIIGILYWTHTGNLQNVFQKTLPYKNIVIIILITLVLIFGSVLVYRKYQKAQQMMLFDQNIWLHSFGFSVLRYLIFSTQFYLLLAYYHPIETPLLYVTAIYLIYLLSAFLPMLAFFDWAVKGSIAVWILGFLKVPSVFVIKIIAFMWITNFLIPFIIGNFLIWYYKPIKNQ